MNKRISHSLVPFTYMNEEFTMKYFPLSKRGQVIMLNEALFITDRGR